jgi:hypothetical protein
VQRNLIDPAARLLNHAELVYAPGERGLARALLEALGCRVLDPQVDPIPPNLGPAAGPYLIAYLDPADDDLIDNVLYASEVRPEQWRFEQALRGALERDEELATSHRALRASYAALPQAMTHLGIAFPAASDIEVALERIGAHPQLTQRVECSKIFRPGEPGAVDDRVVQSFLYTDVLASGLLAAGQQIELQVRLDTV